MKHLLIAAIVAGSLFASDAAEAGQKALIRQQHRAVHQALNQNKQIRKQIQRDARRLPLSGYQNRSLNQVLRQDAASDRAFHRDYHRTIRSIPRQSFGYRPGTLGFGSPRFGNSLGISSRGISFSTGNFSVFLGR